MTFRNINITFAISIGLFIMACQTKTDNINQTSTEKQATPNSTKEKDKPVSSKEMETNESTPSYQKIIVFFGNSLTAGYQLNEDKSFPSIIQNKLIESGKSYKVVNAGLSGDTTHDGLSRIDWVLKQPMDVFVLELGANDLLRGFDISQTEKNLKAIIDKVKDKHPSIPIIIAGMLSPPNMGRAYEQKFNSLFKDLAKEYDAGLIPFLLENVAGIQTLNLPDGKHPNEEGQKIVAENVWKELKKYL